MIASKPCEANQTHWESFTKTVVWSDLKAYITESIELNRDLMEGILTQRDSVKETIDSLRGRNAELRRIQLLIEGWASGEIPIPTALPSEKESY